MDADCLARVKNEVEDLHQFFVDWFAGSLSEDVFEDQFVKRFSKDFIIIPPAGGLLDLSQISNAIRSGYASNTDFRIQIRNVQIQREMGGYLVVTYEEWQKNALATTPANNGRIATAIFEYNETLRWCHIHETSLPEKVVSADDYDF